METYSDNQAMTEVALGLAMAFFALMILSMVSMSASVRALKNSSKSSLVNDSLMSNAPKVVLGEGEGGASTRKDVIIIFYQGRYLDTQLQPINPKSLPTGKRYVLAMAPDLSFEAVLAARAKISAPNLIITELDQAWLQRLTH